MSFFLKSIFWGVQICEGIKYSMTFVDSIKNWIDRIYETMFGKKYVDEDDADRETTHFFNNFDELETKDL